MHGNRSPTKGSALETRFVDRAPEAARNEEGSARELMTGRLLMARALAATWPEGIRRQAARSFLHATISAYWERVHARRSAWWTLAEPDVDLEIAEISAADAALARSIGSAAASIGGTEAAYLIGVLYTTMIPDRIRASSGAYYTPAALCERLLETAADAGVDWSSAKVLDPACGGGAFLAPVAQRMAERLSDRPPGAALGNIASRLRGFEIDPFAAWMAHVFLEDALAPLCIKAGTRLPPVIDVCDSLERETGEAEFDLVVGNPPYGRVKLEPTLRERFRRSLFGHANLYGVFTDLALRLARPGGIVAYVTPASFLGGEYYKALRELLVREAPPVSIDFVTERHGVFTDVLQETVLATYRRGGRTGCGRVHFLSPLPKGRIRVTQAGSFEPPAVCGKPWLVPRRAGHCRLIQRAALLRYRLADYGFKVSTGPLVWNRHKPSLRGGPGRNRYPLIWAESVGRNGEFAFRARKRNHEPYFEPLESESWVVTDFPCVLVQRTTSKEQARRLVAAALPREFVARHGGVVVENHLNMIRPVGQCPGVSSGTLAALLNTKVYDELFRCINGSVAVSAYELASLPVPGPEGMKILEELVAAGATQREIGEAVGELFELMPS